ncbi:class I SAM-dependent methyltransferase [Spirillospora sp. NBC_01491]|uniref:class I SAM-dependent methyltransferase n=1 Tax=Spirillospora sp. NBC_01491 TaxID=2976007 RepID=UPI002E36C11B|nr:SAM-dependent methyltransferase [Spirillospora sp. NBC_01491]
MIDGRPSRTALFAAAARAAHPVVDGEPLLFRDTLAAPLLGDLAAEMVGYHRAQGDHPILSGTRTLTVTRSHYTERRLGELAGRGLGQYVILGAGLDTYAYRAGDGAGDGARGGGPRVFEADHPATQEWKRGLLAAAGIPVPDGLTFVPVDFESDEPVRRLADEGFDPGRPALVSWLGVSVYLTPDALHAALAEFGRLAPGSELIMEYLLPPALRDEAGAAYADFSGRAVSDLDEPHRTFLAPAEVADAMAAHGLKVVEDVGTREAVPAPSWRRSDALCPFDFARLVRATI